MRFTFEINSDLSIFSIHGSKAEKEIVLKAFDTKEKAIRNFQEIP